MKKTVLMLTLLSTLIYAQSYSFKLFNTKIKNETLTDKYCQKNTKGVDFCSENSITYPVATTTNHNLCTGIKKIVEKYLIEFKKGSAKEEVISTLKEMPETLLSYESQLNIRVYSLTKNTFTLSVSSYIFEGGAHGNHNLSYFNYSIKPLKEIGLNDILKQNYSKELKKIAEKAYRDENNYMPNENLEKLGWFKNEFVLSNNYAFTDKGIDFLYNPYEIKPFSEGTTEFSIPYSKLQSLIKPKAIISKQNMKAHSNPNLKQTLKSLNGEISVQSRKISQDRVELKLTMTNLSNYKRGWFSISFPQIESKSLIKTLKGNGFKTLLSYNKGTTLYHFQQKKGVKSEYLLIEGEANNWKKNSSKTITTIIKLPRGIKKLYLNLRGSFKTPNGIEAFPSYGEGLTNMSGQQGFINYRVKIDLL